ncbi:hypothetical protein Cgig2_008200 [Carnegiea gigantea]|uniref:GPN-loop GTPase 2 n=1 Tax=Carnegiea gigantea TaxID=171969 RepID=A0A9Q1QTT5_9CARY|nr:hypothetical protein Cgig2_008200 [Carnegiea gigantea]
MVFGQVVIGPPGSGKTTYCNGMSQFLRLIGRYECAVNIEELIRLSDVMNEHSLGPNGGLVYCMDYLEKNIDWLQSKLEPLIKGWHDLLCDKLTAVHLVDAHLCSDPGKKLTKELCEVVEDFSLVNFTTLDIQDKESVGNLVKLIDKTNGYIFAGIDASALEFSKIAVRQSTVAAVQEKYMKNDDDEAVNDNDGRQT